MTLPNTAIEAFYSAESELEGLLRDAERYRVLREHWLRIGENATVHRALGLDLWCDGQLGDRAAPNAASDEH